MPRFVLAGDVKAVSVLLTGAGVSRRIDVPLPLDQVSVVPPALQLSRQSFMGRERVSVLVQSHEGLREGWIALDHELPNENGDVERDDRFAPLRRQKQFYVAWNGSPHGRLETEFDAEARQVTTKVETLSGIEVIDTRRLRAD